MSKKRIAVFFGGKSYEHDVSILTGLQVCQVADRTKFEIIPVYVSKTGRLFTGEWLLDTRHYPLTDYGESKCREVFIPAGDRFFGPTLAYAGLFGVRRIKFDVAFLAFHGGGGENGAWQGLFETAGIPYTGANVKASAVYMDKALTHDVCRELGINVLCETVVPRGADLPAEFRRAKYAAPFMAKPANLGSSVGIHTVNGEAEMRDAVANIHSLGDDAMIEPFVNNLREYNVAVTRNAAGKTVTSEIEMPTNDGMALSFADKYLDSGRKGGMKKKKMALSAMPSDELINARREFAPKMTAAQEKFIRGAAAKLYDALGGTGAPRIDFLCDAESGEIWLNEANPIPGAFAFHLWARGDSKMSYQDLVSLLIEHANYEPAEVNLRTGGSVVFK
ncbi:MAG: hypothetical protein LBR41_00140 [Rickettsiales bacterium]|jgi:D-alanine-D-alanine ligase|nr:hypothetical protein [Rickettsiales bacterium]